jgi:hypothetical protein
MVAIDSLDVWVDQGKLNANNVIEGKRKRVDSSVYKSR